MSVYGAMGALRGYLRWLSCGEVLRFAARGGNVAALIATGGHYGGIALARRIQRASRIAGPFMHYVSVQAPLVQLVAELDRLQPAVIVGYPTAIQVVAGEQVGGRLHIHPVLAVSAGEWLSPGARERIASAFECKVREGYVASEFMGIAYECPEGWLHVNSDWVIVEGVDAEYRPVPPGEPSRTTLLTNLANRVQPFIRYDIGDSVTFAPAPCPCGNPLPALRVEGRRDDILYLAAPDGRRVPVLPMAISAVVEETPGVLRYQIIQTGPATLRIRIEAQAGTEDARVWALVSERTLEFLSANGLTGVAVERGQEPPHRDPVSGKFREVWSEARDVTRTQTNLDNDG
jgi:phenylacetate-coenzyme A ligase PaaK-like adenylate-forming protein